MNIIDFYYDESGKTMFIQFSTKEDSDSFYRELILTYNDLIYYSPEIISEKDIVDIDSYGIIDILQEYLKDNDLPEQCEL